MRNLRRYISFPAHTCVLLLVMLFSTGKAEAQTDSVSVQITKPIIKDMEFGVYVSAIDILFLVTGIPSLHVSLRYNPLQSIIVLNPVYIRFTERYNLFSKNTWSPYIGFEIAAGGIDETESVAGVLLGVTRKFSHSSRYTLEADIAITSEIVIPNLKFGIHF